MANTALFAPMKLGKHHLKHRIALVPLTRFRATDTGVPTDIMAEYYGQRATDGGLLITEATFITTKFGSYKFAPHIHSQAQIDGWKKVTEKVHAKGGVIFMQIWHIGYGDADIGPPEHPNREFSISELKEMVQQFRQAALNAIEAGFDGVEIHAANDYLLDRFIQSSCNKRTDIYGGSLENRCRFPLEVVDAVVDAIGAKRTAIRLSPWCGFLDYVVDDKPYETWSYLTQVLQDKYSDLAYVHFIEPRADFNADSYNEKQAETLDPFRKIWKGPFISSGGYTYNTQAAFDIAEKTGNMVGFGRTFIANPDLVERLRNGWPLNKYDRSTFYTNDAAGYLDYPFYKNE